MTNEPSTPDVSSNPPTPSSTAPDRVALAARVRALGGVLGPTADFDETAEPRDFFKRLRAWETAPGLTHRDWLLRHGLAFRARADLAAGELEVELWRLIEALAFGRVFLYGTDHLSDAELYDRLWQDVLGAEEPDVPRHFSEAFHWDLSLPEEDGEFTWLAYYATEQERADWAADFPGSPIPPHRPCLHPREPRLPKRD